MGYSSSLLVYLTHRLGWTSLFSVVTATKMKTLKTEFSLASNIISNTIFCTIYSIKKLRKLQEVIMYQVLTIISSVTNKNVPYKFQLKVI
jgi:uncharacterized protein (DUF486 family)